MYFSFGKKLFSLLCCLALSKSQVHMYPDPQQELVVRLEVGLVGREAHTCVLALTTCTLELQATMTRSVGEKWEKRRRRGGEHSCKVLEFRNQDVLARPHEVHAQNALRILATATILVARKRIAIFIRHTLFDNRLLLITLAAHAHRALIVLKCD